MRVMPKLPESLLTLNVAAPLRIAVQICLNFRGYSEGVWAASTKAAVVVTLAECSGSLGEVGLFLAD